MHISLRTMLRATSTVSCALTLAACSAASNDLVTGPGGNCPAATLSRGASHDLVPSGISAAAGGCAHRAPIEVPLARVIDLNDRGEVLGVVNSTGPAQLAVWSITGTRLLTTPAGTVDVVGVDLNNKGEAVGCGEFPVTPPSGGGNFARVGSTGTYAESGAWVCHVIVWSAQGVPTDLGTLDPSASEARPLAINDAGDIVGTVIAGSGQRAFVRSASGSLTFIPTPGTRSAAVALNEQGEVTGWYTNGSAQFGPWHGFVWSQAGGTLNFSDLPVSNAQSSMLPIAINESGDVLGSVYSYRPTNPTTPDRSRTFLHSRADGVGVQDLGFGFISVASINDQGEILGFAAPEEGLQPYTWARSRPNWLAVRFDVQPAPGNGTVLTVNNWNEVLDNYTQAGVNHNVVWTWNPERYR